MQLNSNIASYRDSPLFKLCDTANERVQETLLGSWYGADGMTPTEYFANHVMFEQFETAPDYVDKETWQLIDDEEQPKTAICNHRGDGKTTRLRAMVLHRVIFRRHPMILYVQATHEDAATEMDNVKTEMLSNDFIVEVFGRMKATSFDDVSKTFGRRAWFACNPENALRNPGEPFCFILPRGAGQRVRGRNISLQGKSIRPSLILVDDLEDDEDVLNELLRDKLRNWYFGALLRCVKTNTFPDPATNRWRRDKKDALWAPPWRVFHADTLKHQNALLNVLLRSRDWKHVRYPIGEAVETESGVKYVSLRPERISDVQLANEAQIAKDNRTLDTFYRELLCVAAAKENACFTPDMFSYYTKEFDEELSKRDDIVRFIIVDPSRSASQQADLTGMLAVAIEPKMSQIYIRRAIAEHLPTGAIQHRAIDLAIETNSRIIAAELIGQEGYLDTTFYTAASERNVQLTFLWARSAATPKGDYGTGPDAVKVWRAQQILPDYKGGRVQHHIDLRESALEMHMTDYPRPVDWCLLDCAGYIPWVRKELGCASMAARPDRHPNVLAFKEAQNRAAMSREIRAGAWSCV